jgi:hypothetical protein
MKRNLICIIPVLLLATVFFTGMGIDMANAAIIIDVEQPVYNNRLFWNRSSTFAQSFKPHYDNIVSVSFYCPYGVFLPVVLSTDPLGNVVLASGSASGEGWLNVSFGDEPVPVIPGNIYYLVFWTPGMDGVGISYKVENYPDGRTFVNGIPYNQYTDVTFRTYSYVVVDTDGDGVPDDKDNCPDEDATGFDINGDGCIDSIPGLANTLEALVQEGVIEEELQNSLLSKIKNAEKSVDKGNICTAINQLEAFKNQVNAQRGKKISDEAAGEIIAYTDSVIAYLLSQLEFGENC